MPGVPHPPVIVFHFTVVTVELLSILMGFMPTLFYHDVLFFHLNVTRAFRDR
jgi:hypothetical protein